MGKYSENMVFKYPSSDGVTDVSAMVWEDGKVDPRAILQISHGMMDHKERYSRFARRMASQGVLVCANDHLGHGDSVKNRSDYGYITEHDQSDTMIADMHALRVMMQDKYPDLPYFMLGYSMGSYLLRKYLIKYSEGLKGSVLVGTGYVGSFPANFGILLCNALSAMYGWHHVSPMVRKMAFSGCYRNYDFTGKDKARNWLTRDTEEIIRFHQDPKCTFEFTISGYKALFEAVAQSAKVKNNRMIASDLPILMISGDDDPVGALGRDVKKVYNILRDTGHRHVEMKLYPGARHDILNDLCREEVYGDVKNWLSGNL